MPNFIPFDPAEPEPKRHVRPPKMAIGETVTRLKPLARATLIYLREDMRLCSNKGMRFSIAEDEKIYAIRRDK